MDALDYKFWWNVALTVATGLIAVLTWVRKPGEDAGRAIAKLERTMNTKHAELKELMSAQIAELRNDETRLEERMSHMPSGDEVAELAGDVKAIKAQITGMSDRQTVQGVTLGRIEQYLLNRGRG